jgi:hypothetical protein
MEQKTPPHQQQEEQLAIGATLSIVEILDVLSLQGSLDFESVEILESAEDRSS